MKILINKKIINTLNLNHINVDNKSIYLRFWNDLAEIEIYSWFKNSTLFQCGAFSYSFSKIYADVTVGRYSSISHGFGDFSRSHPLNSVTSSPVVTDDFYRNLAHSHKKTGISCHSILITEELSSGMTAGSVQT